MLQNVILDEVTWPHGIPRCKCEVRIEIDVRESVCDVVIGFVWHRIGNDDSMLLRKEIKFMRFQEL
jgi:hypothetical protein